MKTFRNLVRPLLGGGSLSLALVWFNSATVLNTSAAEDKVPLKLTLPAPAFKGTPKDIQTNSYTVGIRHKILNLISDPNVAYILMLLGFYGLFFELTNPGTLFPGVIGGICLILAFYAFQTLPVKYAGLLLIILAIILFILEVKIVSHGILMIGGIIAMIIGSLMLFESPSPFVKLSLSIILPAVLITALLFSLTLGLAFKALKRKPITGAEGLIGLKGVADTDINRDGGMVSLHGERWSAYSDAPVAKGEGGLPVGRLPGDVIFRRGGFTFYFPIVTGIIVSLVLTILFSLFRR